MAQENQLPTANEIILRWRGGSHPIKLGDVKNLYGKAVYWNRSVKSKGRWVSDPKAILAQSERAIADLDALQVSETLLRTIANQEHLEISLKFEDDDQGYAERVFPWEFVILRAIRALVGQTPLVITRHLHRKSRLKTPKWKKRNVLFVESEPGLLADTYVFDAERENVRDIFAPGTVGESPLFSEMPSPTQFELSTKLKEARPDIVHLTGIDAHEGRWILDNRQPTSHFFEQTFPVQREQEDEVLDGFYLGDPAGRAEAVDYLTMAALLNTAQKKPVIVSFNCQFSAARLAAISVALGAGFGIGIHGDSDESYVENFYVTFYRRIMRENEDVFRAFIGSIQSLSDQRDNVNSTEMVLWSDTSRYAAAVTEPAPGNLPTPEAELPEAAAKEDLIFEIDPVKELNYSVLHNRGGLFRTFRLVPRKTVRFTDVEVKIELHLGADVFQYRQKLDVEKSKELSGKVLIPLTWSFLGTIRESIVTTIYLEVRWNNQRIRQETHKVVVHPVNDWKDNQRDGGWLPSFVLPRDPAVQEIITSARRNLRIITDIAGAKFDGYQSGDADKVDMQSRAIWSALSHNYDISYIDPPPSYAEQSQRLRVPSQVIGQRNATCIDLALIFAACLEYVGLYPVIFLAKNHAFAGYWRNISTFHTLSNDGSTEAGSLNAGSDDFGRSKSDSFRAFEYGKSQYLEIVKFINEDDLVPIETTAITDSDSFENARRKGLHRLSSDYEFDSMLDIQKARRVKVTPLPLQIKDDLL